MTQEEIQEIMVNANSYNRISEFAKISRHLKGRVYWETLKYAYSCSDNLYSHRFIVRSLFLKNELDRTFLMDEEERDIFRQLPNSLLIYRGMSKRELKSESLGVSWTLKKEVAEFFAFKYGRNHATNNQPKIVHQLIVDKKDIIAYFGDRSESEIIYIPT